MHALQATETRCPPPSRLARAPLARARGEAGRLLREESLLAPVWAFRIHPVREIRAGFVDLGASGIRAPAIAELQEGVTAIAAAACTLGPALEARIAAMFATRERLRGAPSRVLAMALDELANERLFRISDQLYARIVRAARVSGLRAGPPENPGDPGIALDEQSAVLALSGIETQAISANLSCMLSPVKSISFVVALGAGLPDRPAASRCLSCASRERCSLRQ